MSGQIFEAVVAINEDYLGPAARRFVARHILFHLAKQPDELTHDDLPKLTEWTRVTMALLTEDKDVLEAYARRLQDLEEHYRGERDR
ncbi:MAG TPA: hypothetical protein VI322_00050 [Candidatus Saccharimonadia bacterium]